MELNFVKRKLKCLNLYSILCALCVPCGLISVSAQNKPCKFDEKTLQFIGSPVEQARCLLRPNKIYGVLGEELNRLPKPLSKIIGEKVSIDKAKLREYLLAQGIAEQKLGGSLDEKLALAKLPSGEEIQTLYFIIHDTSSPYLKDEPFPANLDTDASWRGNNLNVWTNSPVAHIFVNRLGDSLTTTPFSEPVRKGWGTKFARDFLKAPAKGLEIHIELIQPRRREPSGSPTNDAIAPLPGFTDAQYEKLALLYICASARRGTWLIPAYHSAIDAGIKDAHDDPQNFELEKFASILSQLLKKVD
jgi:hypothetical protein